MARKRLSDTTDKVVCRKDKPNMPTVFINKQVVINDLMNQAGNMGRVNNGRQNQVAITVQSPDDELLTNVERAVMDLINVYMA